MISVSQRAGGLGGAENIRHIKELATPPSSKSLTLVDSNDTSATATTARTIAKHHSTTMDFSSKPEERITHPDYGDNVVSPTRREVGLPRNKVRDSTTSSGLGQRFYQTTTSGRRDVGNAHDYALEKATLERVIAFEDAVTWPNMEMPSLKISRIVGRRGTGHIGHSKDNLNKYGCEFYLTHTFAPISSSSMPR
jgi:hypothetical protein